MKRLLFSGALCLGLLLVFACGGTRLVNVTQDMKYAKAPYKKILVIGVAKDAGVRRSFEAVFAERLKKHGVRAEASYLVIPKDKDGSAEEIHKLAKAKGYGAVLVTHYKGTDTKTQVMGPGAMGDSAGGWPSYYSFMYGYMQEPGYVIENRILVLKTNLYDVASGKLVWSGTSDSAETEKIRKLFTSIADAVIDDLYFKGLIP